MRTPSSSRNTRATFNMTPLIDMVFMLILFFTLTLHLEKEQAKEVELPKADEAELVEKLPPRSMLVVVAGDGSIIVDGRSMVLDELETSLLDRDPAQLPKELVVRGDAYVPYEIVQGVLGASARAGVTKVELLASRESEDLR